jgi:hypothetical protein
VWSYLDREWERLEERHIYPGQTILVDSAAGGYDPREGFTGKSADVPVVERHHASAAAPVDMADEADEQEDVSQGVSDARRQYKTIATHCAEVAGEAVAIAGAIQLTEFTQQILALTGLVHDIGKVHPAFVSAIKDRNGIPKDLPLAKAPVGCWHPQARIGIYDHSDLGKRPSFRHELVSALALIELVWRTHPTHSALQGSREEVLDATVGRDRPEDDDRIDYPHGVLADLVALDEPALNLVLYLVMSHHGKVRATLPMSPHDQENAGADGNLPIRGVRDGDVIPTLVLADAEGHGFSLPEVRLHLDLAKLGLSKRYGPSWVERVLALRRRHGSFGLAWLEALFRVSDVRASRIAQPPDSRIPQNRVEVQATPDMPDRDAELRQWIEETLIAASLQSTRRQESKGKKTSRRSRTAGKGSLHSASGGTA